MHRNHRFQMHRRHTSPLTDSQCKYCANELTASPPGGPGVGLTPARMALVIADDFARAYFRNFVASGSLGPSKTSMHCKKLAAK